MLSLGYGKELRGHEDVERLLAAFFAIFVLFAVVPNPGWRRNSQSFIHADNWYGTYAVGVSIGLCNGLEFRL